MKNKTCQQVRNLIIRSRFEALTTGEEKKIASHLKDCQACQNFYLSFNNLPQLLQHSAQQVEPSARIKQELLKKVQHQKPNESQTLQKIKAALGYRIPFYQALSAAVVLWFLAFWLLKPVSQNGQPSQPAWSKSKSSQSFSKAQEHLKMVEQQKGGKSARQDSIYFKFTIPSL